MTKLKTTASGLIIALFCIPLHAQQADSLSAGLPPEANLSVQNLLPPPAPDSTLTTPKPVSGESLSLAQKNDFRHPGPLMLKPGESGREQRIDLHLKSGKSDFFLSNRRNRYSALWAFTSLNYLYADLVGLMDKNILKQYQEGVVDGTRITPGFLTVAAGFMQVPLANVFLPQVIKNEKTLRWVQIASGTLMTLVQSGTLFMGKPAPHYVLFSTIEIGTTAYIAIDAIKWKPGRK